MWNHWVVHHWTDILLVNILLENGVQLLVTNVGSLKEFWNCYVNRIVFRQVSSIGHCRAAFRTFFG